MKRIKQFPTYERNLLKDISNIRKGDRKRKALVIADQIKKESGFDGGVFWEYKRRQQGRKEEAAIFIKDKNGDLIEDREGNKKVYAEFYEDPLAEKEIAAEGEELQQSVDQFIGIVERMTVNDTIVLFSEEEFEIVIKELKKKIPIILYFAVLFITLNDLIY